MAEDATRQRRSEAIAILQALIAGGESYYVEFKSAWDYGPEGKRPRPIEDVFADVGRTLVAFANSDGGDLLVGVEDDGGVTGVPWEGDLMRYLVQAPRSAVLDVDLGVAVQRVELGGETVLWFRVPEHGGEPVVTADGRCLWRREVPPREMEATQAWIASYGPFGLRPEDRKYLVALRDAGGALSNDRLARMLGESFDATKRHLQHLEHQGFVWHGHKSRTYHVVEAPNVPHERALHAFVRERVDVEPRTVLTRDPLRRVLGVVDEGALSAAITRWKQAGILRPDGSKRWRFGESFLRYVANRGV